MNNEANELTLVQVPVHTSYPPPVPTIPTLPLSLQLLPSPHSYHFYLPLVPTMTTSPLPYHFYPPCPYHFYPPLIPTITTTLRPYHFYPPSPRLITLYSHPRLSLINVLSQDPSHHVEICKVHFGAALWSTKPLLISKWPFGIWHTLHKVYLCTCYFGSF